MAAIPNIERAIVEPRKLSEYLLNLSHPQGGPKAKLFLAQGFSPKTLEVALRTQALGAEAVVKAAPFCVLYVVDRPLQTPFEALRRVRAVWEVRTGESVPRLVTAYPMEPLK